MSKADRYSEPINASPAKSFFVSWLTRDIELADAILDLLDNCVDGIMRSGSSSSHEKGPYQGFFAEISFDKDTFMITDNCGGIPWESRDYAFRMGRPKESTVEQPEALGVYGIGMKRAIFKMGRQCLISTWSDPDQYEVEITEEWMNDEGNWHLPVRKGKKDPAEPGTTDHRMALE